MKRYTTRSGDMLTNEDFKRMAKKAERGQYPGVPGEWIVRPQGRP